MRKIVTKDGKPVVVEVAKPECLHRDEILVRTDLAAYNALDIHREVDSSIAPGIEFVGEVLATGTDVLDLHEGEKVAGLVSSGAFAEYLVIPRGLVVSVPPAIPLTAAAGMMQMFTIAWDAIRTANRVLPEKPTSCLVRGANSSIGSALMQLLRIEGIEAIGTVRAVKPTLNSSDVVLDSDHAITGLDQFDVVFNCVGPKYANADLQLVGLRGVVIFIGGSGGMDHEVCFTPLFQKRVTLIGTTFHSRTTAEKSEMIRQLNDQVLPLLIHKGVSVTVDGIFPYWQIERARERFLSDAKAGKVLVDFRQSRTQHNEAQ